MNIVLLAVGFNTFITLFIGFYVHRIAVHLQEKEGQIGRLLQSLFEKLESLPDLPQNFEAPNPIMEIFAQILSQKAAASNIDRSDVGQFTRAEIIPPE